MISASVGVNDHLINFSLIILQQNSPELYTKYQGINKHASLKVTLQNLV